MMRDLQAYELLQRELIELNQTDTLALVRGWSLLAYQQAGLLCLSAAQQEQVQQALILALSQHASGLQRLKRLWQQTISQRYQIINDPQLKTHFTQLETQNWDFYSLRAYGQSLRQRPLTPNQLKLNQRALQQVGSPLYTLLYQAYGNRTTQSLVNYEKLKLVLFHLGAAIDDQQLLQLTSASYQIDASMPPDALFLSLFAKSVQLAFNQQRLTDRRIHQFRMYLDEHNLKYIRQYWQKSGETDEQALANFVAWRQSTNPQYWLRREPARFHNKYQIGQVRPTTFPNHKRLTPDFHSEWIIDQTGQFVSQWQVLKRTATGMVKSHPSDYQLTPDQCRQLLNGESFNYANANNLSHVQLDSWPPQTQDHLLRQTAAKNWRSVVKAAYHAQDNQVDRYSIWYDKI